MPRTATNPQTGQTYELVGTNWVETTPTPYEMAAEVAGPVEAFGVNIAGTARDALRSLQDVFAGVTQYGVNQGMRDAVRAELLIQSYDDAEKMAALERTNPIASFAGKAATYAPAMLVGASGVSSLGRLVAQEAGIGATEGFFSRPGRMAERLQNAALGAAFGAGGAGAFGLASQGARTVRNAFGRVDTEDAFEGSAAFEIERTPLELQAETGVPRLGEAAQREYDSLASNAQISPDLPEWKRNLAARADDLGIGLTTGQRLNDSGLQRFEAGLASNPLTSKPWDDLKQFNRGRLNDLIADALDVFDEANAGSFNDGMLGEAGNILGREFEELGDALPTVRFDDRLVNQLDRIHAKYKRGIGKVKPVRRFVEQLREFAEMTPQLGEDGAVVGWTGGRITGAEFMEARSSLTAEVQRLARSSQGNAMKGTYEIIAAIDDAMTRTLRGGGNTELLNRYNMARDKWRLWDAIDNSSVQNSAGDVSPLKLNNVLRRRYPVEYRRSGLSPDGVLSPIANVFDATKILSAYTDIVGDSGTATRLFSQQFLDQPVRTVIQGAAGATIGRGTFRGTQSRTGSRLFQEGRGLIADPTRSAARLGTITGLAAADTAE